MYVYVCIHIHPSQCIRMNPLQWWDDYHQKVCFEDGTCESLEMSVSEHVAHLKTRQFGVLTYFQTHSDGFIQQNHTKDRIDKLLLSKRQVLLDSGSELIEFLVGQDMTKTPG